MKQDQDDVQKNSVAGASTVAAETAEEKRAHARIPVSLEVDVIDAKTGVCITGRATDVGVGGCYVDAMNTFADGTPVDVVLHWQERKLRLRALVSYAVSGRSIGMGVSFTGMSPAAGATLLDWLTGVNGEARAAAPAPAVKGYAGDKDGKRRPSVEDVIDQLLTLLVRKKVLGEAEAKDLRGKLAG